MYTPQLRRLVRPRNRLPAWCCVHLWVMYLCTTYCSSMCFFLWLACVWCLLCFTIVVNTSRALVFLMYKMYLWKWKQPTSAATWSMLMLYERGKQHAQSYLFPCRCEIVRVLALCVCPYTYFHEQQARIQLSRKHVTMLFISAPR